MPHILWSSHKGLNNVLHSQARLLSIDATLACDSEYRILTNHQGIYIYIQRERERERDFIIYVKSKLLCCVKFIVKQGKQKNKSTLPHVTVLFINQTLGVQLLSYYINFRKYTLSIIKSIRSLVVHTSQALFNLFYEENTLFNF